MKIQISKDEVIELIKNYVQDKLQENVEKIRIMYECDGKLCELYENIKCFEVELKDEKHKD